MFCCARETCVELLLECLPVRVLTDRLDEPVDVVSAADLEVSHQIAVESPEMILAWNGLLVPSE